MHTCLRDIQFSALCVAASMVAVGTMTVCPVLGVKCLAPLKLKIRSKECYIKWITFTYVHTCNHLFILSVIEK